MKKTESFFELEEISHFNTEDKYNLQRFVDAQEYAYRQALSEIKNGRKESHWIWYIFPQLCGLGHSYNSKYYGLSDIDEARAYLSDSVLGNRLREISEALLKLPSEYSAVQIFGHIDAKKVKSCMTIFDYISPNDIFGSILLKYYGGDKCNFTEKECREYEKTQANVSMHITNIYKEGELDENRTYKKFLSVQQEGFQKASRKG